MDDPERPDRSPLRVGVDITSLLHELTGVGVFARELVDGLAARDDVDLQVFAVSWRGRQRLAATAPRGATVSSRAMPARVARWCWSQTDHPTARYLTGGVEVVHGPNFVVPPGGGAAEVVTVHDLTALHFPEMCTPDVLEWPGLLRRALRRGAWVHTVSSFVADEVRAAFPQVGERVVTVPNGVLVPSGTGQPSEAELVTGRRLAGGTRYVVALGTVEPRKDLPTLVRAFDLVAGEDPTLRLVIAGSDGPAVGALEAAVRGAAHRDRVVRVGRVDDHERVALLRGASVVAYPSRYEGFGMVPLEAMAAGTPVVATAVGAVAEVVGDAALLVSPEAPEPLAEALRRVLDDERLAASLVEAGRVRVGRFPWSATVEGMVALYQRAAEDRRSGQP